MRRVTRVAVAVVAATAFLAACRGDDGSGVTTVAGTTTTATRSGGPGRARLLFQPFDSCDGLLGYLKDEATKQVTAYGLGQYGYPVPVMAGVATTAAGGTRAEDSKATAAPTEGGSSTTNTQETDVDEGDLVENDGHYVYSVVDGRLRVVDIPVAAQVADADLPPGGQQIVLSGDRLVVVTSGYAGYVGVAPTPYPGGKTGGNDTVVSVFDVNDPTKPKLLGRSDLEGTAVAVRSSDGVVRVVMRSALGDRLPFVAPTSPTEQAAAKALAMNKDTIATSAIGDWLPRSFTEQPDGTKSGPRTALDCASIGRPDVDQAGWAMTWIAAVDLSGAPEAEGSAGVVADGSTVYATTDTIYVATPRTPAPADGDVRPIRPQKPATIINSFALSGTSATYEASGQVDGWLLNQFSMSALDGSLRVATTEDTNEFGSASASSVRVLRRDGDQLVESGALTGLGKGERIYAVRFVGELGYVVTFRQTDPLYVVDLHDPNHPAQVGELKIPGYSAYLHPIDDGFLLGLGQGGNDRGQMFGSKLSLFDVRDPAKPTELDSVALDADASTAMYDHHAFLWWPDTRQVILPVNDYTGMSPWTAKVISVGTDHLELQGAVNASGDSAKGSPVMRSMVVDGELVTVGYGGLQITALDTLAARAFVAFS